MDFENSGVSYMVSKALEGFFPSLLIFQSGAKNPPSVLRHYLEHAVFKILNGHSKETQIHVVCFKPHCNPEGSVG